jgi:hypothetical protein
MSRLIISIVMALNVCAVIKYHETPRVLLIVRDRLRPGTEEAYEKNELQIATVCASLKCPHLYLALTTDRGFMANCGCSVSPSQNAPCRVCSNGSHVRVLRRGGRF